jgi:queuine/archaeosine tRNA-ribosyltransferase
MNRVSGTIEWEATLRRLGIDVNLEEDRAVSMEQCEKEWEDIMMESTRRKRRSKMKKHKYASQFSPLLGH